MGRHRPPAVEVELVVARYREAALWTRNVPPSARVTIYDKGGDLDPGLVPRATVVRLPNVGLEAGSYLHHLVERHDRLAPVTVFCQGHPFDHAHDLHHVVRGLCASTSPAPDFRWLGFIVDSDDARGRRLFVPWSKNVDRRELALDQFHEALFGEPCPPTVRFFPGGQFVVTAACARRRPREFYERALELARTFPDAGHCFERVWDRVFGVSGVPPELADDAGCRYLKPIRRLLNGGKKVEPDSRCGGCSPVGTGST